MESVICGKLPIHFIKVTYKPCVCSVILGLHGDIIPSTEHHKHPVDVTVRLTVVYCRKFIHRYHVHGESELKTLLFDMLNILLKPSPI
jgi:hypothetical protein